MIDAMEIGAPMEHKTGAKHRAKSWGYPDMDGNDEFAMSCSCGFNHAGIATIEEAIAMETGHWKPGFAKPFNAETLYTKKGEEVETQMTDDEAHKILIKRAAEADERGRPNSFIDSLVAGREKYGQYTDGQRPWLHKLANEHVAPKPARKLSDVRFPLLLAMMQTAAMDLTKPRITFDWNGRTVQLSIAGSTARVPGSLNVTDGGPYGESTWYGRIIPNGNDCAKFDAGRAVEDWVIDALTALNEDPQAAAAEHGHRTGRCCFCNLVIKTTESLAVGYGPICADHYGLPWG